MWRTKPTKKHLSNDWSNMDDIYLEEEWQPIPGYPNYEISNFGRVFNARHNRFLKPFIKFGYEYVTLYYKNEQKDVRVHRLVALAFIPVRENAPEVNHDDGDKEYNYVENLEWSTRSENMLHAFRIGLKFATNKKNR
jgi:hypothetical protein